VSRVAGVAVCAAVAWFGWHRVACASGSHVVILYEDGPDGIAPRAEMRLAAELRAAGFEVEERASEDTGDPRSLVERAAEDGAFATVLLRRATAGAFTDVWVADQVTHKTVARRIAAGGVGDPADRALALRVVELMRASLVEGVVIEPSNDSIAPSASPATSPPPDVIAWTREAVKRPHDRGLFELGLGVAGVWAGPELGIAVAPQLRLDWAPSSRWSVGLLAAGPAFGARVAASEGSATIRQELALAEASVELGTPGPVVPHFAAGGGIYHFASTGYPEPPYTSRSDDVWAALLAAGVGARLPLAASAALRFDVRELLALPRPVVAFAGHQVAASMRPGTLAALLLSVSLQ